MTALSRSALIRVLREFGHAEADEERGGWVFFADKPGDIADAVMALVRPENEVKAEAFAEAELAIQKWLDRFTKDRSTSYREGKADGASAALGAVQSLRGGS